MSSPRTQLAGAVVALALAATACAAGDTQATGSTDTDVATPTDTSAAADPGTTTEPAGDPTGNSFPDETVFDVTTGEPINLRSLADTGTPVAMWFYYPH